tara:strand:- start:32506 stop:32850 length:345 start_codon:yes stop_codon:yes gene_type:complete
MITAKELKKIATEAKIEIKKSTLENSLFAVEHFTKNLHSIAGRGKFKKETTCLVSHGDHREGIDQNFNCQTGTGGEGFTIENMQEVIELLEKQGFTVEFNIKGGYCPFNISWSE